MPLAVAAVRLPALETSQPFARSPHGPASGKFGNDLLSYIQRSWNTSIKEDGKVFAISYHLNQDRMPCATCVRTGNPQNTDTINRESNPVVSALSAPPFDALSRTAAVGSCIAEFGVNAFNALIGGACAAAVARTVTAPWERLKMDLQLGLTSAHSGSLSGILGKEGVKGLFKGNMNNIIRSAPFKGCNFMFFDVYKNSLFVLLGPHSDAAQFIAGAMSGASATLVCYPLDVARTRHLAGSPYGGFWNILRCIPRHEHWTALYSGIGPALVSILPTAGVYFGLYEYLKVRHIEAHGSEDNGKLPVQFRLLYGAVAGAATEVVGYPFELIRRRMQVNPLYWPPPTPNPQPSLPTIAALPGRGLTRVVAVQAVFQHALLSNILAGAQTAASRMASPFRPMVVIGSAIWRTKGPMGFYAGLPKSLVSCVLSSATGYCVYEASVEWLRDVEAGRIGLGAEVVGMLTLVAAAARSVLMPPCIEEMQDLLQLDDAA